MFFDLDWIIQKNLRSNHSRTKTSLKDNHPQLAQKFFKNRNSRVKDKVVAIRPKLGTKYSRQLVQIEKDDKELKLKLALLKQQRGLGLRKSLDVH